ncbi:MAG: hypothetical protein APR62_09175 [Smithella sp. SDB]|nr:MAG: hypothetical protein APR62_09175 [Smithella sp. SDB]
MKKIMLILKSISIFCLFVSLLAGISGCATTRHTTQNAAVNLVDMSVDDLVENLMRQNNPAVIKDGFPGALMVITGMIELAPINYNLLATASFLYADYALFVEDENVDYAISLFKTGTEYGMRALKANNAKFRKAIDNGMKIPEAVKFLTKDDLKALTWYGINLSKRVTLQLANPDEIIDIQDAVAAGRRSIELDPNYAWGASWNILGIYYAIMPVYAGLGGGAESSKEAFAKGNKVENGEFGLIDVFIARYLCRTIKDPDLFDQLLNRVLAMDSCKLGNGLCMINELAKQKARFSLANKAKYFD